MKQRIAVTAAIILTIIQFTAAQDQIRKFPTEKSTIEFATKNLLVCLRSDNPGVVESALKITAEMRILYPSANMSELIKSMNVIKKHNRNGTIRYKAFIAVSICENPEWYAQLMGNWTENSDAFFHTASVVMNEQRLTSTK